MRIAKKSLIYCKH